MAARQRRAAFCLQEVAVTVQSLVIGGRRAGGESGGEGALGDDGGEVGAAGQVIASPDQEASDVEKRSRPLVAPHGTVALFDPPADGPFAGVVGPSNWVPSAPRQVRYRVR